MSKAMFSTEIVESDAFLSMPKSAQLLYFRLGSKPDNDGFVGNPLSIIRLSGCSKKDYQTLLERRFIIDFASGVCVIKHHWINNIKRKDRYQPTKYQDELALLIIKENGAYSEKNKPSTSMGAKLATSGIPNNEIGCPNIKEKKGKENKNNINKPSCLRVVTGRPVENFREAVLM
jgi:hypothetical protein